MNRLLGPGLIIGAIVAIFIINLFVFTVNEREQGIVLRFGDPVRTETEAGLKFKAPIENVVYLDKRNLEFDGRPEEIFTVNQERLVVDAFVRYQIEEPLRYYESFRASGADERSLRAAAETRIAAVLESSLREVLGGATDIEIIRDDRADLMREINEDLAEEVSKFGVRIIDVKIRRADFPKENEDDVYNRMRSERVQIAQRIRAEGDEAAQRIRAQADRAEIEIRSRAQRQGLEIQGQADATRNCIFAGAYDGVPVNIVEREPAEEQVQLGIATTTEPELLSAEGEAPAPVEAALAAIDEVEPEITCDFSAGGQRDPQRAEFFAFYRSLLAYEEALRKGETTILLSPDSEFFRYFNDFEIRN